jgi:hypothetical protein
LKLNAGKNTKLDKFFHLIVGAAVAFVLFHFIEANNEVKNYEDRHVFQMNDQFEELHALLYSMEETLDLYEFPIQDDKKSYYHDALDKDIQRLDHLDHTIRQLNDYPDFMVVSDDLGELVTLVKGLKGFKYTEEEKRTAIEALSEAKSRLYSLLEKDEFSLEVKADREAMMDILDNMVENLSVLKK